MKVEGWILDAGVCEDYIELWIKLRNGKTIPGLFKYYPSFYAKPKNFITSMKAAEIILHNHDHVYRTEQCKKFTYVYDNEKSDLFRVFVDSPRNFERVIKEIEETDQFSLFNTDIPIAQTFLYDYDLFPMGFCEFELVNYSHSVSSRLIAQNKKKRPIIQKIMLKDSNEEIFYKLPPLRVVHMKLGEFGVRKSDRRNFQDRFKHPKLNEPLISCEIDLIDGYNLKREENCRPPWNIKKNNLYGDKEKLTIVIEEETELETIAGISKEIESLDPDIILTDYGDEFFFPFLIARASANHIDRKLYLSRDMTPFRNNLFKVSGDNHYFSYGAVLHRSKTKFYLKGRIHIDTRSDGSLHFQDGNIFGVVEVARVSRVPIQRLTRITIGGALQSIQFYIAGKKGYLVPPEKKNSEDFQTAAILLHSDRGGHIFEPMVGVFERVVQFYFTSL